jgi:uncharacterized protein (TIGR03086 family)
VHQRGTHALPSDLGPVTHQPVVGDAPPYPNLPALWRSEIPARLDELAAAWREPAAWDGMTQAGGATLPAPIAGQVALNELVVHGWDLARATSQPFDPAESAVRGSFDLGGVHRPGAAGTHFRTGGAGARRPPLLDRAIGLSGRDPAWSPDTVTTTSTTGQKV